jgi:ribosomal protein S18 acetylase RimI-like enzyme
LRTRVKTHHPQAAYAEYAATSTPSSALVETTREVFEGLYGGKFRAAVATIGGKTVGAVRYKVDNRGLYFFRLAVHPAYRRRGVAQAFVTWLEAEARRASAHRLWCQVRLIVPQNVALYEKNGFALIETHIVMRNGNEVPTGTMEKRLSLETVELTDMSAETDDAVDTRTGSV